MKIWIDNCKHWWKMWSIRLNSIGLAILGWVAIDPVSALAVYNMLPGATAGYIPRSVIAGGGAVLFALSMLSRLVRQPKLEQKQ